MRSLNMADRDLVLVIRLAGNRSQHRGWESAQLLDYLLGVGGYTDLDHGTPSMGAGSPSIILRLAGRLVPAD